MDTLPRLPRRVVLGSAIALAAPAVWRGAIAQGRLRPTPSQTEGPFYPVELPAEVDADLLVLAGRRYAKGQAAWLEGTVSDVDGRAVSGATVEIWQCDPQGHYHHPGDGGRADPGFQGFGRVTAGPDGAYRFRALRPAPYRGRTPHIHLKVKLGVHELLTTQVYVRGDPGNARDLLWQRLRAEDRAALTVPFEPSGDALRARFPIVVEA
jgi:protocatechuate 3,4-dioxygenase beta subunit